MIVYSDIDKFKSKGAVTTVGIFDGVHKGHKKILSRVVQIANEKDLEPVVFTLWPHPRQFFKRDDETLKFVTTIDEKIDLLEKIGIKHLIIYTFDQDFAKLTACEFIKNILVKKLNTKYLIAGFNHKFGRDQEGSYDNLLKCAQDYDFEFERLDAFVEKDQKVSSTLIREAVLEGKIQHANNLLGYEFFITGQVVGGSKIGRKIGFPTANIEPFESYKLKPSDGVYAVKVDVDGDSFKGMLNIGYRPTIDGKNLRKSCEVHIIDFDNDLYNKKIKVHFVKKVRPEKKFDGILALQEQLVKDKKEILKILS